MLNNNSHFGEDDKMFLPTIFIVVFWSAVIIKYLKEFLRLITSNRSDYSKIFMYISLASMGLSYLYKFLHLYIYYNDGKGIFILYVFYLALKNVTEGVIATILVSIAWGWSIIHLKHDYTYLITGTIACIANIICLLLVNFA